MQLAHADAGSVDAVLTPGYLHDAVSESVAPWDVEARRLGIVLQVPALDEAPARFDGRLVTRLVGVLLHNALQYTPTGGPIEVRVQLRDGRAVLDVEDSGVGIAADDSLQIFERSFRGSEARQRAPEGSGLGLAIAAWVARQHYATMEVNTGSLGGALFRVIFPPLPTASLAPVSARLRSDTVNTPGDGQS